MGLLAESWPPKRHEFFLDNDDHRPVFQGDVFDDVPFVKVQSNGNPKAEPVIVSDRRRVCVIGYPCDIYNETGAMSKVQSVAIVRELRAGERVPADWNGSFSFCPLPDLDGDGRMWVVDFRAVSNLDRVFLTDDRRICSLSETGWAVFRQRMVLCYTRAMATAARYFENGRALWFETELWQAWCAELPRTQFQMWFHTSSEALGGFSPSEAVYRDPGSWPEVSDLLAERLPSRA